VEDPPRGCLTDVPGLACLHDEYVVLGASGAVRFRFEDGVIRVVVA